MRIALACLGCLAAAGTAAAGPVWVQYRFDAYTIPATTGEAGINAFAQHRAGQVAVDGEVSLAAFRFSPLRPVPPDSAGDGPLSFDTVTRFALKVALTDMASGEMGVVRMTGAATHNWFQTEDGRFQGEAGTIMFDGGGRAEFLLGGHEFDVLAEGKIPTEPGAMQASVRIRVHDPAVLESPEPGTLVLAGVGVAASGGYFARRRRPAVTPSS
jgi:hypothetical protein